jgi:hypothetical protein
MASKVSASVTSARPRLSVVLVDAIVTQESVLPSATVSAQKPAASASYVAPTVVAASVIPAADIAYISMVFSADIDVSGLFSYKIDSVSMQDGKSISFTKSPSESFVVLDGIAHVFEKSASDSVSLDDLAVATLIFIREFAETQDISDSTLFAFAKYAASSVLLSDDADKSMSLSKTESVALLDLAAKTVAKYFVDSVNSGDTAYLNTQKFFNESQSIADSVVQDISKLLADDAIPADALAFSITKSLSDGFGMNDSAESTDGLTFSFSIGVANIIFASDAEQKDFAKIRTDSFSLLDSGLLTNQDYIDPTYFAEDYVGASYVF